MHKYENEFEDRSNMLNSHDYEYDYSTQNIPDYVIIKYDAKDCLRNDKVRKYLITKHMMGL